MCKKGSFRTSLCAVAPTAAASLEAPVSNTIKFVAACPLAQGGRVRGLRSIVCRLPNFSDYGSQQMTNMFVLPYRSGWPRP
ncbi:exported hypothetical protein [Paraburkholderia tropica]|nr:exported hypothetical protein [Paraburkholderia tropica]